MENACEKPTAWWFQPVWKIFVQIGSFPHVVVKNKINQHRPQRAKTNPPKCFFSPIPPLLEGKNPYSYVSLSGEISETKPPIVSKNATSSSLWSIKTRTKKNKRTNDFFHHRETNPTGNSAPNPSPQSWIPRPRMEVEPPFASVHPPRDQRNQRNPELPSETWVTWGGPPTCPII